MKSIFKKGLIPLILFFLNLIVWWLAKDSNWVEQSFSTKFYPKESAFLRKILVWIPFSVGDLCIAIVVLFVIYKLISFFRHIKKLTWRKMGFKILKLLSILLIINLLFNLLWGLNYYRKGISCQLHIQPENYSTHDLNLLSKELANKGSLYRRLLPDSLVISDKKQLFETAVASYDHLSKIYPFLRYKNPSIKYTMFSELNNYLLTLGYYNPFSGEAQINAKMCAYAKPFTTCHEMAHQLGYATEDEANFVGYLAAVHSDSIRFRYAAYASLFSYANDELFYRDSNLAKANIRLLTPAMKNDFRQEALFYLPYRTSIAKVSNLIYGQYLKANNQPQGMQTYTQVVAYLIAYMKLNHNEL